MGKSRCCYLYAVNCAADSNQEKRSHLDNESHEVIQCVDEKTHESVRPEQESEDKKVVAKIEEQIATSAKRSNPKRDKRKGKLANPYLSPVWA